MNNIPFEKSTLLDGISFTGRHKNYTNADTWYPSWASDGNLYSPWTDGYITDGGIMETFDESHPGYACNSLDWLGRKAATAQAKIVGDDPLNLNIINLTPRIEASPEPYEGRYPCGTLVHDGVWYYGTYCLIKDPNLPEIPDWHIAGPFVGFRYSTDYGKTWIETPHTPANPIFGEHPSSAPVKIVSPHFVDFGKNMQYSPDGKAYMVAHGSTRPEATNNWIAGDQIYLLRVSPSIETINNASTWEFFAGYDDRGNAEWTNDFTDIQPLLEWEDHLGCVTVTYHAGLQRYLMCVTNPIAMGHYDAIFLEAERLTGSWRWFDYKEQFGPEGYFINIPSKFISVDNEHLWLIYSANWSDKHHPGKPEGSAYSLSIHEIKMTHS